MSNSKHATDRNGKKADFLGLGMTDVPFVENVVEIPVLRRIGNQKAACDEIKITIACQSPASGPPRYKAQVLGFNVGAELSLDAAKHQFRVSTDKMVKAARGVR